MGFLSLFRIFLMEINTMFDYDELAEHFGSCSMSELFEFEFGERTPTNKEVCEYIDLLQGFSNLDFPTEGKFKLSTKEGRDEYWNTQDTDSWFYAYCCEDGDEVIGENIQNWLACICTCHEDELNQLYAEHYEE